MRIERWWFTVQLRVRSILRRRRVEQELEDWAAGDGPGMSSRFVSPAPQGAALPPINTGRRLRSDVAEPRFGREVFPGLLRRGR
jgi:hypothetical protein